MIAKENVAEGIGLIGELDEERRQERAEILLPGVLEVEKEIGYVG
jgi:hypothetical protein